MYGVFMALVIQYYKNTYPELITHNPTLQQTLKVESFQGLLPPLIGLLVNAGERYCQSALSGHSVHSQLPEVNRRTENPQTPRKL